MSGHCSHELRCSSACQLNSGRRRRKICARGTGGLSDDGDSARGACAAAAALREHARDPGAPPHSRPPSVRTNKGAAPETSGLVFHISGVPSFLLLILASRRPPSRPTQGVLSLSSPGSTPATRRPHPRRCTPSTPRLAHQHEPIRLAAPMGTERKRQALNKQKRALTGADTQAQPGAPALAKIKKKNSKRLPASRLKASRRPLNGSTKKKHLATLKPGAAKAAAAAAAAATTQAY